MGKPCIFLDRDGTLLESALPSEYVRPRTARWLQGSVRALKILAEERVAIVIVSNQAGVGAGAITDEEATSVHDWMVKGIDEAGGRLDATFYCKHAKDAECECRKPRPGMLIDAAKMLDLDLGRSTMIGDALTDYLAAVLAGLGSFIHVGTGQGQVDRPAIITERTLREYPGIDRQIPIVLAQDLLEAVLAMTGWPTRERFRLALHGVTHAYR